MEPTVMQYHQSQYLDVSNKCKVSKNVKIKNTPAFKMEGKIVIRPDVNIRAELGSVELGLYCIVMDGVIIRPSHNRKKGVLRYDKLKIGSHVFIDKGSIIQADSIGSNVHIGKNCIIG